jgi:hypothetical protein
VHNRTSTLPPPGNGRPPALKLDHFTAEPSKCTRSPRSPPAESAQGLITDYQVLEGNPADSTQVKTSLDRHRKVFRHPPAMYAGERGFYSADNTDHCEQAGVSRVCIPQRGGQKTDELNRRTLIERLS